MLLLPESFWEIKKTQDRGLGLFARKDILKGIVIGDYIGTIIHPKDAEVDDENFYLMYYHDTAVIVPDLNLPGVHLLNHSCIPNVFLYIYKGHTLAFALRKIKKGEELTIHYLLAPKDEFCEPCLHVCLCGGKNCTGTMHLSKDKYDKWRMLTENQSKETKRQRVRYGKVLPSPKDYPEKIHESYIKKVKEVFGL